MNYDMNNDYYVIRSLKMMMYLVRNGFDIIKVGDSEDNKNFKVFLFIDSKELRQCMSKFSIKEV